MGTGWVARPRSQPRAQQMPREWLLKMPIQPIQPQTGRRLQSSAGCWQVGSPGQGQASRTGGRGAGVYGPHRPSPPSPRMEALGYTVAQRRNQNTGAWKQMECTGIPNPVARIQSTGPEGSQLCRPRFARSQSLCWSAGPAVTEDTLTDPLTALGLRGPDALGPSSGPCFSASIFAVPRLTDSSPRLGPPLHTHSPCTCAGAQKIQGPPEGLHFNQIICKDPASKLGHIHRCTGEDLNHLFGRARSNV